MNSTRTEINHQLLDQVLLDYLQASRAGHAPAPDDLYTAYPELKGELESFFEGQAALRLLADPLKSITTADALPQRGATVSHFELVAEIASGGMGVIYKARHTELNRLVALKMIRTGALASPEERHRFQVEVEAVALLDHPAIVPIYEVGEYRGQPFYSMKLIEGGNLGHHLPRYQNQPRQASRLVAAIARAVHYAHRRGILHRDLKPANILMDEEGRPHVTDFGLAKRGQWDGGISHQDSSTLRSGATQSGIVVGTPSYMPPEQAQGQHRAISTAADVYSLGAILYELLTGRPPFRGDTPMDTLMQVLTEPPTPPSRFDAGLPKDLEVICLKCLEKEPGDRYASAEELADELERLIAGKPIQARPASGPEKLWRWCRRNPVLASVASAGLAALAATFIVSIGWAVRESKHAREAQQAAQQLREEQQQTKAALKKAEQNSQEAQRQRGLAKKQFQLAHQAVHELGVRVEEELRHYPNVRPVRKRILQRVQGYYQRFLEDRGDDSNLQLESAEAYLYLCAIARTIGTRKESLAHCQRALAIYQDLLRTDPDNPMKKSKLAKTFLLLGTLYHETGRFPDARSAFDSSHRMYANLTKARPNDDLLLHQMGALINNQAALLRSSGKFAEALKRFHQALTIRKKLVQLKPDNDLYQFQLALCYRNLGAAQGELRNHESSLHSFHEALQLNKSLIKKHPNHAAWQDAMVSTYREIGTVLTKQGRMDEALRVWQTVTEIREGLARGNPRVKSHQFKLAVCIQDLGIHYRKAGKLDEARTQFDSAGSILARLVRDDPSALQYRSQLALNHFRIARMHGLQGDHLAKADWYRKARVIQEKLVKAHPIHDNLHNLANTLHNLAVDHGRKRQHKAAQDLFRLAAQREASALAQAPAILEYRNNLSAHYTSLAYRLHLTGQVQEAVAVTLERRKLWPKNPGELYQAAVDLAKISYRASKPERQVYYDHVIETLRQAISSGFRNADRLAKEPAFQPMRTLPGFQDLTAPLKHLSR